jgi:hypothetical protein
MKNMLEHIGPDLELSKKLVTDPDTIFSDPKQLVQHPNCGHFS